MSPKMVLVWMSWAFVLTSFINCQTIDDALENVFKRLANVERVVNVGVTGNTNTNCNSNNVSVSRRNLIGDEGTGERGDNEENGIGLPVIRSYDELADETQRSLRLKKPKRNRKLPYQNYYPSLMTTDLNANTNQNVNSNNIVSRRSYIGAHHMAIPIQHDPDN